MKKLMTCLALGTFATLLESHMHPSHLPKAT